MKGIELGRSISSVALAPRMSVGNIGGFRGFEAPKVAISIKAQSLAKEFAPIQISKPNIVEKVQPVLRAGTPIPQVFYDAFKESVKPDLQLPKINLGLTSETVVKPRPLGVKLFHLPGGQDIRLLQPQVQAKIAKEVTYPQLHPQTGMVEEKVEELVQEQRVVEPVREDEDVLELKRVYLEDEDVSEVRRKEMRQAIKQAFEETVKAGLDTVTGELVAKFLPEDHEANRSQIVKRKGPDGSNHGIVEQVVTAGNFYTEDQAQVILDKLLEQNRPVKLGKNNEQGKKVTLEEVKKVLRPKRANPVVLEFLTRVVRKRQISQRVVEYQPKREILEGADYGI